MRLDSPTTSAAPLGAAPPAMVRALALPAPAEPEVGHRAATGDETIPGLAIARRGSRARRFMALSTIAVLTYALAILVVATLSADLGFFTYQGGPIVNVEAGSNAAAAGLLAGDAVLAVDGVAPTDGRGLTALLDDVAPGDLLRLEVLRDGAVRTLSFVVPRTVPLASAAGAVLASLLLALAILADRTGSRSLPRAFFRSTLVYVVFLAGAFSLETALRTPALTVPWLYSMVLAAPVTCHFMLRFPAGRRHFSGRELVALYALPLAVATFLAANHVLFMLGSPIPGHHALTRWVGAGAGVMAAAYLTFGALSRGRRLRRLRDEVDPVAVRWLQLGHVFVVVPLIAGLLWATRDLNGFIAGGFRPFVAVTMVGGVVCVVLALTRTPFGELDRLWRRSSGYFLATSLAAAVYLALIGFLGGTASALSGGDFQAALAATLAAAVVFGPLRVRVQRMVDERFARDRSRARRMLREAAEAAVATLDIDELQAGVVQRARAALAAEGAAIFVRAESDDPDTAGLVLPPGGGTGTGAPWRQVVLAGAVGVPAELDERSPIGRRLDLILSTRTPRQLTQTAVAIPLPVDDREPAALVVAPRDGERLDDEELELLATAAANLVVALGNARAHRRLLEMTERLRQEVEIAERRRREIARLKERVEAENRALLGQLATRTGKAAVIGAGLERTFELVQKVSRSDASVLVHGETGVGKELVARAIHAGSARKAKPFIVVDCGALAAGVIESALFGHERGAFTGAVKAAPGAFRAADGGTIFLDEVGELPLDLQPKLLRVLQEREVQPLGGDAPIRVDVRVVCGTNRDLAAEVAAGRFREDLVYRLQVVEIEIPPLRTRKCDIPALAEHFLLRHAERSGRTPRRLAPDALEALLDHDWPGNVRELEHALEAAAVYAEADEIRAADLPIFDQLFRKKGQRAISEGVGRVTESGAPRAGLRETLEDLEKQRLLDALREHEHNRSRTAKALGMSRGALLRRLKRYDLDAGA